MNWLHLEDRASLLQDETAHGPNQSRFAKGPSHILRAWEAASVADSEEGADAVAAHAAFGASHQNPTHVGRAGDVEGRNGKAEASAG